MLLRDNQKLALQMARDSVSRGFNRPILSCPTSFGKTVVAGHMMLNCQNKGKRGWFLCDRIKLVSQSIERFSEIGVNFGVHQSNHALHNPGAPIQIVSIQTLLAMVEAHNGALPEFEFAVVDEAHIQYEIIKRIMREYNKIPIIGLTATPYSKGLGKMYNALLVPVTPRELLDQDMLTPIRYYGGKHINRKNIKSEDTNTFNLGDLEKATTKDKKTLTGDIISNWLKWGENSQTIAFSPSQKHSKYMVKKFNEAGISAEHIDCYSPKHEREQLYEAHDNGEFKILSCSRLLNTGYDAPSVRCLIDCFPVKSVTTYVQRAGRITRKSENKEYAIYLDHAGNFDEFGYAEDIVPTTLDNGEKSNYKEIDLIRQKDGQEAIVSDCPMCYQKMQGVQCMACGYEIPIHKRMIDDGSILEEIQEGNQANKKTPLEDKQRFMSELIYLAAQKGYQRGWAAHQYREKFAVWPNDIKTYDVDEITDITKGWIKHQNIKRAHSKSKSC